MLSVIREKTLLRRFATLATDVSGLRVWITSPFDKKETVPIYIGDHPDAVESSLRRGFQCEARLDVALRELPLRVLLSQEAPVRILLGRNGKQEMYLLPKINETIEKSIDILDLQKRSKWTKRLLMVSNPNLSFNGMVSELEKVSPIGKTDLNAYLQSLHDTGIVFWDKSRDLILVRPYNAYDYMEKRMTSSSHSKKENSAGAVRWGIAASVLGGSGFLFYLTYFYLSWDIVEPITFFVGSSLSIVGYFWWLFTETPLQYNRILRIALQRLS